MMSDVQRYGIRHDVLKGTPDGEFVTYKDYQKMVQKFENELAEAYGRGFPDFNKLLNGRN